MENCYTVRQKLKKLFSAFRSNEAIKNISKVRLINKVLLNKYYTNRYQFGLTIQELYVRYQCTERTRTKHKKHKKLFPFYL